MAMMTAQAAKSKPAKNVLLKARCDQPLKDEVAQFALQNGMDAADVIRQGVILLLRTAKAANNSSLAHG